MSRWHIFITGKHLQRGVCRNKTSEVKFLAPSQHKGAVHGKYHWNWNRLGEAFTEKWLVDQQLILRFYWLVCFLYSYTYILWVVGGCRWTRSNWAYLNEPPVIGPEGASHKFAAQFHVAGLSASKANPRAEITTWSTWSFPADFQLGEMFVHICVQGFRTTSLWCCSYKLKPWTTSVRGCKCIRVDDVCGGFTCVTNFGCVCNSNQMMTTFCVWNIGNLVGCWVECIVGPCV